MIRAIDMKITRGFACFLTFTAIIAAHDEPACAQLIDYGSLQSLFGEPVTSSATGTPQRASDVPANMTIITAEDIRRSGVRNIPQIIGMYVPGTDIFQSGVNAFDVGIRGYQQPFQPRLLVLVDGRQVFIDDYSRTAWENIPVNIDDIRQIEVVKGASSALFGSNASGGVVNIITYSPIYDNDRTAAAGFGTQNERFADATMTAKAGTIGNIKISGGAMSANEFDTDRNNPSDPIIYNPMHRYILESSVFQVSPNLQATTEATYSESRENTQQPDFNGRSAEDISSYSARAGFVWQSGYGLITSDNYLNHSYVTSTVKGIAYPQATDLVVSRLQDQFKVGTDNTLRAALEYRHKYFNDANIPQSFPQSPRFDENVYAADGSWLWQLNNRLSWTNALRFEHQDAEQTGQLFPDAFYSNADYDHVINNLSINSGITYKATDMDTVRATYGRGVQLPAFIQSSENILAFISPNIYYDLEGNPHLKPTIVQNYELDYDHQLPEIYSTMKFAAYYQMNQDIISFFSNIGPTRVIGGNAFILAQSDNVGNSQGWGGEVELKGGSPSGFRWDASYSYARDVDSSGVAQGLGYDGSTPAHHFRLLSGYTKGAWEFDANGQLVSSSYMLHSLDGGITRIPNPVGGYFTLGSRIGYALTDNLTLALSGANLTRANTQESPFPAIERQAFLSLTGRF